MKSENRMSKEAVKRRLNSIFGDYSEFYVKPTQREAVNDGQGGQKESGQIISTGNNTGRAKNQDLSNGEMEEERNEAASINNMIEQIVDIPRPLSPVLHAPNEDEVNKEDLQNKVLPLINLDRSSVDLEAIINQISCVSPLLTPVRLDIFNSGLKEEETSRKRPNSDEEIVVLQKLKKSEEQSTLIYSIKFCAPIFKKLLKRLEDQRIKESGKLVDFAAKLPSNVCNKQSNNSTAASPIVYI